MVYKNKEKAAITQHGLLFFLFYSAIEMQKRMPKTH